MHYGRGVGHDDGFLFFSYHEFGWSLGIVGVSNDRTE